MEKFEVVGGRLAAFFESAVHLFDVDTGAQLASFDVERTFCGVHEHAALDRWLLFDTMDGRALLLDCMAMQIVEMAPPGAVRSDAPFSAADSCVSVCVRGRTDIVIVHVSGGSDGAMVARQVARVRLSHNNDLFALCERDTSCLLHTYYDMKLRLVELATGQPKRVFAPRACDFAVFCCSVLTATVCAAAGRHVGGFTLLRDCVFVLARIVPSGQIDDHVAFRFSGNARV